MIIFIKINKSTVCTHINIRVKPPHKVKHTALCGGCTYVVPVCVVCLFVVGSRWLVWFVLCVCVCACGRAGVRACVHACVRSRLLCHQFLASRQ